MMSTELFLYQLRRELEFYQLACTIPTGDSGKANFEEMMIHTKKQ